MNVNGGFGRARNAEVCPVGLAPQVHLLPECWSRDDEVAPVAAYQHEPWPTQVQPQRLAICVSSTPRGVWEIPEDSYKEFIGDSVDEDRVVPEPPQFQTSMRYRLHDCLLPDIQFSEFLGYRFTHDVRSSGWRRRTVGRVC